MEIFTALDATAIVANVVAFIQANVPAILVLIGFGAGLKWGLRLMRRALSKGTV